MSSPLERDWVIAKCNQSLVYTVFFQVSDVDVIDR